MRLSAQGKISVPRETRLVPPPLTLTSAQEFINDMVSRRYHVSCDYVETTISRIFYKSP